MAISWSEVAKKEEYNSLSDEEKAMAQSQYFESVVAPQVPEEDIEFARSQFQAHTKEIGIRQDAPTFLDNMWSGTKRLGGVGIGILNSPSAFAWGSMNAQHLDKEQYDKLPPLKQALVSMGGGLDSAWKSISKKGEYGTIYDDYFRETTGKSIYQSLPDNLKWAAPTLGFLGDVVADPAFVMTTAKAVGKQFAKTIVPKNFQKTMPKQVLKDLEMFDKLEGEEKQVLYQKISDMMSNRKGYMEWWKGKIDEMDAISSKKGPALMKPGERSSEGLKAPQNAMAGQPKEAFATKIPKEVPEISKLADGARLRGRPKGPEGYVNQLKLNEYRKGKGLPPVEVDKAAIAKRQAADKIKVINDFRKSKGLPDFVLNEKGSLEIDFTALGKAAKKVASHMNESEAWAKVHGMVGKAEKSFDKAVFLGKLNEKFFDRFGTLKKKSIDTYNAARTFSAYKDNAKVSFDELKGVFKPVKNSELVMTDYISAHRAMSRAERGIKNPNGVTLQDAKQAIADIEKSYKDMGGNIDELKTSLKGFQEWTDKHILRKSYESGIISKSMYDKIKSTNEWYATFDIIDHLPPDLSNLPNLTSPEYFSVANQKIIKSMIGTEKKMLNPLESTINKFMQAQQLFERNKVASTFIDDPGTKGMFRPVAKSKKEFAIMKNKGLDPVVDGGWNKNDFDAISRFKDGRVEKYVVEKDIAEAMKQLSPKQAPKFIQAVNTVFRKAATSAYLPFTISNAFRDGFMAYTTAPVYKTKSIAKFGKDWTKGFWEGAKHEFLGSSDLAKEYISSGGGFGYVGNIRNAKLAKSQLFKRGMIQTAKDIITSPIDLIEKVSSTIELAPRLGVFQRAKMAALPAGDAALMARQSTIDFNRGGSFTKVANQWIPFLNARVQGRVTLATALKNDTGNTLAKVFASTAIPGMSTYAWNRLYYSKEYDDIPEDVKQNYFVLITGTTEDKYKNKVPKYFVIPKGDVGQMAWNPIEFGLDAQWKKDPKAAAAFFVNYLNDLSPVEFARDGKPSITKMMSSVTPPIGKAIIEPALNINLYYGKEIVPHWMENTLPPELQYKENTPEMYKKLGKVLKVSPEKIKTVAGNIVAGYGREGGSLEAMMRGLTGRLVKTRGGEIRSQAFISIKDIENGYVSARGYAKELVKNGDKAGAIKLMNEWNHGLNSQIKEFNNKFKKYDVRDKGGLSMSYRFTGTKRKNILMGKKETDPLENRLSRRKR